MPTLWGNLEECRYAISNFQNKRSSRQKSTYKIDISPVVQALGLTRNAEY